MDEATYEGEERNSDRDYNDDEGSGAVGSRVQVPPTLLPNVLHRLGLTFEAYPVEVCSEITVEDLITDLKSDDWLMRIAAVRRLGKLGERVPVELLGVALEDEDSSVRAAAVRVLGCAGKRAPLPRLVAALHDADWHVRETAVYVLGDWRQDIPGAELANALHDVDGSVRQAARLILHGDDYEMNSVMYGRLWEQKSMQQRQEPLPQNEEEYDVFRTEVKQDAGEAGQSEYAYILHEQTQTYDSSRPSSYERIAPMSEHWEKVTNLPPRSRSQKGWWAIVAATAVVFFLLGSGVTSMIAPAPVRQFSGFSMGKRPAEVSVPDKSVSNLSQYANIVQKEVSAALKMNPDTIRGQLKEGKHMSDIAAAQGISADQLHQVELQALIDASNSISSSNAGQPSQGMNGNGVGGGQLPQGANGNGVGGAQPSYVLDGRQSTKFLDQLKGNPQLVDELVTQAFLMQN